MYFDQREYDIRFEWGLRGLEELAPISDLVIIVDVLSFTTSVDVVVGNQGVVFPYLGAADGVADYAKSVEAVYASRERDAAYSLSPAQLATIPAGTRLVLPSPNGSTLSMSTGETPTMAGCLRNARAVAAKANELGQQISVIGAGEKWQYDQPILRPGVEDLLGAGAIISFLNGRLSPEAEMALAAFESAQSTLKDKLYQCSSGKELIGRGFEEDVYYAAQFNVSEAAPLLVDKGYRDSSRL